MGGLCLLWWVSSCQCKGTAGVHGVHTWVGVCGWLAPYGAADLSRGVFGFSSRGRATGARVAGALVTQREIGAGFDAATAAG